MNAVLIVNFETRLASVTANLADVNWNSVASRRVRVRFFQTHPVHLTIKHSVKPQLQNKKVEATPGETATLLNLPDSAESKRARKLKIPEPQPNKTAAKSKPVEFQLRAP